MHGLDDPVAKSSAYPSPWLSSLNEDEREAATSAALRSLKARQLFDADLVEDAYETWVEPHLAALLTMRRGAEAVVIAERTVSGGTDWVVLHAQPRGLWLEEIISHQGMHDFALVPAGHALTDLTVRIRSGLEAVTGAIDLHISRRDLIERAEEVLAPLADALGVTSVTRVEVVGERTTSGLGVIVSPEFTVVSQELAEGSTIRYRSVDDAELRSALHTLLRPRRILPRGGRGRGESLRRSSTTSILTLCCGSADFWS
ncbi:hypothetical protein BJF82_14545 [Kytococcus sp. CUA-901]|nr:hypothetical protein BJF82_14545 [Kytococcus sp. CUA-901]